jgi:hypothetical protein
LSDEELAACHAHEYGREIAKRCRYVSTQLKILWRANELPKNYQQRGPDLSGASIFQPHRQPNVKRHPDRIRGDGATLNLWTFGIPIETLGNREFEKRTWYSLPANVRSEAVRSNRDRAEWQRRVPTPAILMRSFRELPPSRNPAPISSAWVEFLREYPLIWLTGGNVDYGFFAIDWDARLPVLKKQILTWLKERHTNRRNVEHVRQSKPSRGQLRDQLRWLGALRCKEHYGRKHLTNGNEPRINVPAPYRHVPDLYVNASKAKNILDNRIAEIMQPAPWLIEKK